MSIAARVKGIFDPKDLLLEYFCVCYDGCIYMLRHLCTCSEETLFMPTGSCCIFVMLSFFDLLCISLGLQACHAPSWLKASRPPMLFPERMHESWPSFCGSVPRVSLFE